MVASPQFEPPPAETTNDAAATAAAAAAAAHGELFPGGPGTSLTLDDLNDAYRRAIIEVRPTKPFEERVTRLRELLGENELRIEDGNAAVFYGIGGRNSLGPYRCMELYTSTAGRAHLQPTDRLRCGLPRDARKPDPPSLHPRWPRHTITRIRDLLPDIQKNSGVLGKTYASRVLGPPDYVNKADTYEWHTIGPRDDYAPLTCHVLSIRNTAWIEQRPLSDCDIEWPVPRDQFAPLENGNQSTTIVITPVHD